MSAKLDYVHRNVERLFPGLPPVMLRNHYLLSAWIRWLHNDRDMELLAQQSCLEQALEAIRNGWDLTYLSDYSRDRLERLSRSFWNRNLPAPTQTSTRSLP